MASNIFEIFNKNHVGGIIAWDAAKIVSVEIGMNGRKLGSFYSKDWSLVEKWLRSEFRNLFRDRPDIYQQASLVAGNCFSMALACGKDLPGTIQWTNNFSFRLGEKVGWAYSWAVMEQDFLAAIDGVSPPAGQRDMAPVELSAAGDDVQVRTR